MVGSSASSLGILLEIKKKKKNKSFVGSSICKQHPVELYCSTSFAANHWTLETLWEEEFLVSQTLALLLLSGDRAHFSGSVLEFIFYGFPFSISILAMLQSEFFTTHSWFSFFKKCCLLKEYHVQCLHSTAHSCLLLSLKNFIVEHPCLIF